LRARLVDRAENWPWGSLAWRLNASNRSLLTNLPIELPKDWVEVVNETHTQAELDSLRNSVVRGTPYGDSHWQQETAAALGLEHTLRPRGRPKRKGCGLETETAPKK
jgi:putative transposase